MKHYSIRTKVSILFAVVFFLVSVLFLLSLNLELDARRNMQSDRQKNIIKSFTNSYDKNYDIDLLSYLLGNSFTIVKDSNLLTKIKKSGDKIFKVDTNFGVFSSISYENHFFLQVQSEDYDLILQSNKEHPAFIFIIFWFLFSFILTSFLYISIIKALKPLNRLREEVAQTAQGHSFSPEGYNDDEVGKIAMEFYHSITTNQQLIESRQLFLRTIMHELKTPIAKARIIAEMMKEEKQKQRLVVIFNHLNSLINESAKIEALLSRNYKLQIKPYPFSVLLNQAKIFLMYDNFEKNVEVQNYEDGIFNADIEVFPLVIKNLIDNAIKYSVDKLCIIESYAQHFIIKNKAEPLKRSFGEYLKAFTRDRDNKSEGMGLGLYIIERICIMHNFSLNYEYKNGFHEFEIASRQGGISGQKKWK